jgi:lipid-A-disaccharide synthase
VVQVPWISLVNLIAGREVIRELIQEEASVENLTAELSRLLREGDYRKAMLASYKEVQDTLDTGSASNNAAQLMVKYLRQ